MKNHKQTAVAMSAIALFAGYAQAQTVACTSGTVCLEPGSNFGPGSSPVIESRNTGSVLHFTAPDVEVRTAGGTERAILARDNGSIIFDGNLTISPSGLTTTQIIVRLLDGGDITVSGNFDLLAETGTGGAPGMVYLENGVLNVGGNLNLTMTENSDQGAMMYLSGSFLDVRGKAVFKNQSSSISTMVLSVQDTSKAIFNELEITTDAKQGFIANGTSTVASIDETVIIANNLGGAGIWFGGYSLVSLGEKAAVTQQMENNRTGIGQLNIGAKAKVYGDYALRILSSSHDTYVTIKGVVDSDNYAVHADDSNIKQMVLIDGGQVRGAVALFRGDDRFTMASGTLNGTVDMGLGNDAVEIAGGKITGSVYMNAGADTGRIKGVPDLSALTVFDGGSDGTSTNTGELTFDATTVSAYSETSPSSSGVYVPNWDKFSLVNGSLVTMTGTNIMSASTDATKNLLSIDHSSTLLHDPATTGQVIVGSVANAGHMSMGNNLIAGDRWTIEGNYAGNNGLVTFDTVLGGDGSLSDKLVVQGDTLGTTRVKVNNAGGIGALTQSGIEIIEVLGQSNGIFVQDGRIVAGAFDYKLDKGNTANGTNSNNWYLTSYASPVPPPFPPGGAGNGGGSGGGWWPSKPKVRPEAGSYLGLMEHNRGAFNHSFHDRQQLLDNQYESSWGRIEYSELKTYAGMDEQLRNKARSTLIHIGTDVYQDEIFHLGVMGAYNRGDVNSRSRVTGFNADGKSDGYSVGVYASWFNQNKNTDKPYEGYYVDTYVQYNWFNNKVDGQGLTQEKFSTKGFVLSAETGYSFLLNSDDTQVEQKTILWTIEPQAQLAYSLMNGRNHWESNGTYVELNSKDNWVGRVGVRLQGHSDESFEPFVTLNYWYNNHNETVHMSNIAVQSERSRHLFEVKAGGQFLLPNSWKVYGQLQGRFGQDSTRGYGVNIGVKHTW